MQAGYRAEVETRMKQLYVRLSEKDRRRYAAVEADKLGHGGFEYIAKLFDIDPKTIRQGLKVFTPNCVLDLRNVSQAVRACRACRRDRSCPATPFSSYRC